MLDDNSYAKQSNDRLKSLIAFRYKSYFAYKIFDLNSPVQEFVNIDDIYCVCDNQINEFDNTFIVTVVGGHILITC